MISIAICTIPERYKYAKELQDKLDNPSIIVVDNQMIGPWNNMKKCWKQHTGDYHLVLQDDIEICDNFIKTLHKILSLYPKHYLNLYNYKNTKILIGNFFSYKTYLTGQASVMPSNWISPFLYWDENHANQKIKYSDHHTALWQKTFNIYSFVPYPSIVQHTGTNKTSLFPNKGSNSRSPCFFAENGLTIPWSSTFITIEENYKPMKGLAL